DECVRFSARHRFQREASGDRYSSPKDQKLRRVGRPAAWQTSGSSAISATRCRYARRHGSPRAWWPVTARVQACSDHAVGYTAVEVWQTIHARTQRNVGTAGRWVCMALRRHCTMVPPASMSASKSGATW
uniref:Uncharacterized protein n=1 Tax=Aegilops tauschii subsp. strangulata TaxID=200361 RepID=A0A453FB09_AEGTS